MLACRALVIVELMVCFESVFSDMMHVIVTVAMPSTEPNIRAMLAEAKGHSICILPVQVGSRGVVEQCSF